METCEAIREARKTVQVAAAAVAAAHAARPAQLSPGWRKHQEMMTELDRQETAAKLALSALEQACYEPSDSDEDSLRAIQVRISALRQQRDASAASLRTAMKRKNQKAATGHQKTMAVVDQELIPLQVEMNRLADTIDNGSM